MKLNGINIIPYNNTNNSNLLIEKEFTENQRKYIKTIIQQSQNELKESMSEQFQTLQLEIIRQFQIQQNQIVSVMEKLIFKNANLEEKIKSLSAENENLK